MSANRDPRPHVLRAILLAAALLLPSGCGRSEEPPAIPANGSEPVADAQVPGRGAPPPPSSPTPPRRSAWVIFGADTVVAEVARTTEEKERGLMYRTELPDGTGMIFLFTEEDIQSLWMSNTYVALDVAFLDANLRVVDIQQMEPETTDIHSSARRAMFALELPKGWLAAHGVEVGDVAQLVLGPL
jgi:uncharacterized membrane protein (UPF0127 family)